jgi:ribonuclease BN (tRNA processing enzyme)
MRKIAPTRTDGINMRGIFRFLIKQYSDQLLPFEDLCFGAINLHRRGRQLLISMSNQNQPTIIELRGEPQKHREIRGVSIVTFGSKNEATPLHNPRCNASNVGARREEAKLQLNRVLLILGLMLSIPVVAMPSSSPSGQGPSAAGLQLLVLGSGGPGAGGRASSSYLLLVDGTPRILVDAGPGSFVRLGEAQLDLGSLDVVLLTHLHVDHAAELPGIIKARAVASRHPIHFDIFGPEGHPAKGDIPSFPSTRRFMNLMFGADGAFAYLKDFAAPVSYTVMNLPRSSAPEHRPELIYQRDKIVITAMRGHHGDAPAVVYRVEANGRSVVFSGDIDAEGLPALAAISQGANLLVFDAVVLDPPGSPEVLYSLHSPPKAIGELAERDHIDRLLLSHLSPAVDQNRGEVVASIAVHYHGSVVFADDGLRETP